jgi:hypothetical protein
VSILLFRVYWWIRGAGKKRQGSDIIESDREDFDESDAEKLAEKDLDKMRGGASIASLYSFPVEGKKNLVNFCKMHQTLSLESRHSEISNWGISRVEPVKETKN